MRLGDLGDGLRWLLLWGAVAGWPLAAGAAPEAPTVQALLAEQDAQLVRQIVAWTRGALELPEDMALDPPLRAGLGASAQALAGRLQTLVPAWIAEERTAAQDPALRGPGLAKALYLRSINELQIGFVESTGEAHDAAWLKAALAPTACKTLYDTFYARRIAMVQAAPPEVRTVLLAAEQELLARWGTVRHQLPARPAAADMAAAAEAVAGLRDGLPVTAAPMTPFLAGMVYARDRKPGKPDRWERCATSQWWLQTQLAAPHADRHRALQVFRYSLLPDVEERVPEGVKATTGGKADYPRAARYFEVEGTTSVRARLDDQGKVLRAEVVERQIRVPGVRGNRPLAFETLLDDAALELVRRQPFAAAPSREVNLNLVWKLEGDDRAAR